MPNKNLCVLSDETFFGFLHNIHRGGNSPKPLRKATRGFLFDNWSRTRTRTKTRTRARTRAREKRLSLVSFGQ